MPVSDFVRRQWGRVSRRDLFRTGGWLAAGGLLRGQPAQAQQLRIGADIYQSLGVRPLINARGTITVITGSLTLPEVKAAMDQASRHFVQIDELMDAVGKRLGELTGAQWGMVTTGGAGALSVATVACAAGADPDKLELLANQVPCAGLKTEVVIPRSSRNVYDHSIRAMGVKIVEPATMEELELGLGPNTAMVMMLTAARDYDQGPLSIENVAAAAHRRGIPVLSDAAAEILAVPNIHLKRGADLVSYSGGKCIRGPQCAGLLLGRKDLVQAAWVASAPHHTVCRSLKVGKEEIVGMLAAVEMWMKRDHAAEEKTWMSWLETIAARLKPIAGVTTEIRSARGVDNRTPILNVQWDRNRIELTEDEMEQILWDGDPRISIGGKGSFLPFPPDSSYRASITPYQMSPGEEKVVADRLYQALSTAPKPGSRKQPAAPAANLSGVWDVHLEFVSGAADHTLTIEQSGNDLTGTHQGQAAVRDLKGTLDGANVVMRSSYTQHGARLNYTFRGTVENGRMQGGLLVGEYGEGRWSARRHEPHFPGSGRPLPG
jgi:seryl-tRNA(Sec) selenium transferase